MSWTGIYHLQLAGLLSVKAPFSPVRLFLKSQASSGVSRMSLLTVTVPVSTSDTNLHEWVFRAQVRLGRTPSLPGPDCQPGGGGEMNGIVYTLLSHHSQ